MRLTMKQRQAATKVTAGRYQAGKKEKKQILDEFCGTLFLKLAGVWKNEKNDGHKGRVKKGMS
jgi:hypothetical protein